MNRVPRTFLLLRAPGPLNELSAWSDIINIHCEVITNRLLIDCDLNLFSNLRLWDAYLNQWRLCWIELSAADGDKITQNIVFSENWSYRDILFCAVSGLKTFLKIHELFWLKSWIKRIRWSLQYPSFCEQAIKCSFLLVHGRGEADVQIIADLWKILSKSWDFSFRFELRTCSTAKKVFKFIREQEEKYLNYLFDIALVRAAWCLVRNVDQVLLVRFKDLSLAV